MQADKFVKKLNYAKRNSYLKYICKCGHKMKYFETEHFLIEDESENKKISITLDSYVCPYCEYKIWVYKPSYEEHVEQQIKFYNIYKKYNLIY